MPVPNAITSGWLFEAGGWHDIIAKPAESIHRNHGQMHNCRNSGMTWTVAVATCIESCNSDHVHVCLCHGMACNSVVIMNRCKERTTAELDCMLALSGKSIAYPSTCTCQDCMLICSWLAGFGQPPVCIHHSLGDSPCIQLCNGVWLLVCGAKQVWYVQASTIGLYPEQHKPCTSAY